MYTIYSYVICSIIYRASTYVYSLSGTSSWLARNVHFTQGTLETLSVRLYDTQWDTYRAMFPTKHETHASNMSLKRPEGVWQNDFVDRFAHCTRDCWYRLCIWINQAWQARQRNVSSFRHQTLHNSIHVHFSLRTRQFRENVFDNIWKGRYAQ